MEYSSIGFVQNFFWLEFFLWKKRSTGDNFQWGDGSYLHASIFSYPQRVSVTDSHQPVNVSVYLTLVSSQFCSATFSVWRPTITRNHVKKVGILDIPHTCCVANKLPNQMWGMKWYIVLMWLLSSDAFKLHCGWPPGIINWYCFDQPSGVKEKKSTTIYHCWVPIILFWLGY